jgi:hypothetical protein
VNLAVTRQFTVGGARLLPGIERHNAFNASTVHTIVNRYGPAGRVCVASLRRG